MLQTLPKILFLEVFYGTHSCCDYQNQMRWKSKFEPQTALLKLMVVCHFPALLMGFPQR